MSSFIKLNVSVAKTVIVVTKTRFHESYISLCLENIYSSLVLQWEMFVHSLWLRDQDSNKQKV